jgi:hypothetical protein
MKPCTSTPHQPAVDERFWLIAPLDDALLPQRIVPEAADAGAAAQLQARNALISLVTLLTLVAVALLIIPQ